jgi:hypothetical protein
MKRDGSSDKSDEEREEGGGVQEWLKRKRGERGREEEWGRRASGW